MNIDSNLNEDMNQINNEIIYEENTELSSEEEILNEEDDVVEKTDTKENTGFNIMDLCNVNNLMIFVGLLVLVYLLFREQVDKFINDLLGNNKPNLCV
jgi:hypothetical protein